MYRTVRPIAGLEAGLLVYFHNHSQEGPPIVLLPENNQHNRWTFSKKGSLVVDDDPTPALQSLKAEGFYRLREHFHPDAERVVAKGALAQLGYNRAAEPILFFPSIGETDNSLVFPEKGMKVPREVYELLESLDTRGPQQLRQLH